MDPLTTALRVTLVLLALVAMCVAAIWLVRQAKRGGKRVQAVGAVMMALFSWGNMRDPRNNTVAEAQDGRLSRGNESGDPPR